MNRKISDFLAADFSAFPVTAQSGGVNRPMADATPPCEDFINTQTAGLRLENNTISGDRRLEPEQKSSSARGYLREIEERRVKTNAAGRALIRGVIRLPAPMKIGWVALKRWFYLARIEKIKPCASRRKYPHRQDLLLFSASWWRSRYCKKTARWLSADWAGGLSMHGTAIGHRRQFAPAENFAQYAAKCTRRRRKKLPPMPRRGFVQTKPAESSR